MEDLNKYMNNLSTLSSIKERVQLCVDKKEEFLKRKKNRVLSVIDEEDHKKLANCYQEAVNENSEVIDLILEFKNEIFKIKLIKESIDRNTQIGINQIKVIDNLINMLNDMVNMMYEEKSKYDRIVRYYEKTFSYFNVI